MGLQGENVGSASGSLSCSFGIILVLFVIMQGVITRLMVIIYLILHLHIGYLGLDVLILSNSNLQKPIIPLTT